MNIQIKKWAVLVLCLLLAVGCAFYAYAYPAKACYHEVFAQKATDESEPMPEYAFTTSTAPDLYRVTPRFDTGLTGANYTVTVRYQSDTTLPLYWATLTEYDASQGKYPVYECATLEKGENSVTFTLSFNKKIDNIFFMLDFTETQANITLESVELTGTDLYNADRPVLAVLAVLLVALFGFGAWRCLLAETPRAQREKALVLLCLTAVFLAAVWWALQAFTIIGHDVMFHNARIESIAEAISQGQIPHRSGTGFNEGYGYMNSAFYPELFLYLPALLICLGCSLYVAVKVFYIASILAGVLVAYYAFSHIGKSRFAGVAATALYTLCYYRYLNTYVRYALGEMLFLDFLPLVLYGVYNILYEDKKNWLILALGCTCVLQSHIIGTLLTGITCGVIIVAELVRRFIKKCGIKEQLKQFFAALGAILCLNAWFLVPLVYYMRHDFSMFATASGEPDLARFFNPLVDPTLRAFLAFAPTQNKEGLIFAAGPAILLCFLAAGIFAVYTRIKLHNKREEPFLIITGALVAVLLVLTLGIKVWHVLVNVRPLAQFAATVQFPFRFMGPLLAVACCFLCVAMQRIESRRLLCVAALVCVGCGLFTGFTYLQQGGLNARADTDVYIDTESPPEYLLKIAAPANETALPVKVRPNAEVTITAFTKDRTQMDATFTNTGTDSYIDMPMLYYKGYHATLETGEELPVTTGDNGVIRVLIGSIPAGNLHVQYRDNIFFKAANLLSLASAACLIGLQVRRREKQAACKE